MLFYQTSLFTIFVGYKKEVMNFKLYEMKTAAVRMDAEN
jgi:hypothetical protein